MRVQFGAIITAGAGKAGGQIIQRGRTGQVLRNLTKPVTRRTLANAEPRFNLTSITSNWKALTVAQRTGWSSLASTLTRYNKFGVAYVPNGYQIYSELNMNASNYFNEPLILTAPVATAAPSFTEWEFDIVTATPSVVLNWSLVGSAESYDIFISFFNLQSPGASVPRGSSRRIDLQGSVADETMDLSDQFTKRFGVVPPDVYSLFVAVNFVQFETGFRLPTLILSVPFSDT